MSSPATPAEPRPSNPSLPPTPPSTPTTTTSHPDIIVAGALAVDFSCDYAPFPNSSSPLEPIPHTSNPAIVSQTLGGVAHNIAKAAHLLGASVELRSAVGPDLTGHAALHQLSSSDMSTSGIHTVPAPARTAQYIAVNNADKDLALAMADMSILETIPPSTLSSMLTLPSPLPTVLVTDANWSSPALHAWLSLARSHTRTTTIFEPVSTAKATRIFPSSPSSTDHLHPIADIVTPNALELSALHAHATSLDLFSSPTWFRLIDALGIPSSGLRVPLAHTTSPALVDAGIPQQAIKLLPFFPTVLTKLGARGVLLVQVLEADDPALRDEREARYVLARCRNGDERVGGLYVRLYPAEEVGREEVVSVNGCGDTFVGAVAVGIARGGAVRDVVPGAVRAAALTLRSGESVSPELKSLKL